MEKVFIVSVALIGVFAVVNSLQCYECSNCPDGKLKDEHLMICGDTTTTVVNPTVTSSMGTPTTVPVDPSSTSISTAAPVDPSSTSASTTASVNPSSTSASTTASVNPSPTSSSTTVSVDPSSTSSSTTVSVDPGSTISSTTVPVDPSSLLRASSASIISTSDTNENAPQAIRVRRHAQPELIKPDSGCTCHGGQCACNEEAEVLQAFQYADETNTTYVCAKATFKINGTDVINRGCAVPKINDHAFCDFMKEHLNATKCSTCTTDKCNSAFALQDSIGVLLLIIALGLFTK